MPAAASKLSPMMAQYKSIKEQHEDALLFYRMGDFYEMFFDDAIAASEALDIALTKRGKIKGVDIPMCGVPVHSADNYLQSLIRKGFRVAVCEQTENPAEAKKRGYKAVVAREVVRLVTPGTLTEDTLLDARRHNYLAAVGHVRDACAVAWVDISSGNLHVMECPLARIAFQLARVAPREILLSENASEKLERLVRETDASLTPVASLYFDSLSAKQRMSELFEVRFLDAFGEFSKAEFAALGAIVTYLELTQKGRLPLLRPPAREKSEGTMQIDSATRRNLEITKNLSGGNENTLLSAVDRTLTAAGARLLLRRISAPSTDVGLLQRRLDNVQFFVEREECRTRIRSEFRRVPDIDRALSRLCLDRAGPRDVAVIRTGLEQSGVILEELSARADLPIDLSSRLPCLGEMDPLAKLLSSAVVDEPPLLVRDGGFVAKGYCPELDEERKLRDEARAVIAEMQREYMDSTGISALKIKYNNVLGYFVETTSTHADRMLSPPLSEQFIHRQTTANAVRFTTTNLSDTESRILNADGRALEMERRIFEELRSEIIGSASAIAEIALLLADLDVAAGLAENAVTEHWCRPELDNEGGLKIVAGRHPVVEQSLGRTSGTAFVANDSFFSGTETGSRVCLLTGPNMSGKSTYLRQNALAVLLAQAGSFIPAASARIGIVSQLFSRVGAADELARGRSTFMVEMVETAAILNQANRDALVILDEIGRGTATYDGLSIAWATLEHIHDVIGCRTLFATHYHELTRLSTRLERLTNATVSVREWEGEVIFLHEVREGCADRSYGVQVAKLAGIPTNVVERAEEILNLFESDEREGKGRMANLLDDLPLFSSAAEHQARPSPTESEIAIKIRETSPDELTPLEALALLYELKSMSRTT